MIDRSSNLRAIVTGKGNSAGFTSGARAHFKKKAHVRMRQSGKDQIADQLCEMQEDRELPMAAFGPYEPRSEEVQEEREHQKRLAVRRARYHARKIERQVEEYGKLVAALKKLDKKLEPESRHALSIKAILVQL